jgi:hypothetical protein
MDKTSSRDFVRFTSPYLAVGLARGFPMLGYLGIESGGRGRRHLDVNLLRPGAAGVVVSGDGSSLGAGCEAEELPGGVRYRGVRIGAAGALECEFAVVDDRTFRVRVCSVSGELSGGFFRIAFAPDVSPPSLWARPVSWEPARPGESEDIYQPPTRSRRFHMPGLLSLPDFGLLQIEADSPDVTVLEEVVPDASNAGLNLGLSNDGNHTARKAYHHGQVALTFELSAPTREVALTFRVQPERFPRIAGCDFSDARWDALRRCWMNAFTLDPASLSLGDNYILGGLGHLAIHWKSDLSVFTPPLLPGLTLHDFFRSALRQTFESRVDDSGKMKGYGWENAACNLIALHAYLLGTNDWDFVREHLPTLRKVIDYHLALDADDDGILEAAYHGNHFHDEKTSLNWWDAFAFGHKDAYGNLVFHQALRRTREILHALGETDLTGRIDAHLAKARASFHRTFYNPQTGVYAGWISADGRVHDYYFTFITAMAINEGLVPDPAVARDMLQRLLDKLDENGYGDFRYGVPGPAAPVDADDRTDWAPMSDWGRYENGGFCGQTAYHFLLALYRAGMREQADRILFSMLDTFEHLPTHSGLNPGFCKSCDWRTRDGHPCGYNYLADNYVFLLAAIQGHFGVDLPELGRP